MNFNIYKCLYNRYKCVLMKYSSNLKKKNEKCIFNFVIKVEFLNIVIIINFYFVICFRIYDFFYLSKGLIFFLFFLVEKKWLM